jgi:hypothetical protein
MLVTIHKYHVYNEVFFLEISWLFIHPFTLIPLGLVVFPSLGPLQDRTASQNR